MYIHILYIYIYQYIDIYIIIIIILKLKVTSLTLIDWFITGLKLITGHKYFRSDRGLDFGIPSWLN